MASFTKMQKVALGISTIGGTWCFINFFESEKKPHNSWTTNYAPTAKWDDNWDHRCPKSLTHPKLSKVTNANTENQVNEALERATPTASRHIILIRHGQYNMNGNSDNERYLTSLGRVQAEHTGKRLQELGFPYTSMIKSTMMRAQETGEIINAVLSNLPVTDCNLIREGAPIPPEPPVGHWKPEKQQFYQDGARIEAGFREYFYRADASQEKDTFTILVCHANVIRYFVCRALQFPPEAWLRISLNHGSITWITITPKGRVILRALGDSGHIPVSAVSY